MGAHGKTVTRIALGLGVAVVVLLAVLEAVATYRTPTTTISHPWASRVDEVNAALARHDTSAAVRALHETYVAALASRQWEPMMAHGDAAMAIANASGVRRPWVEQARQSYLMALFRARSEDSLDGALRAAEAFHRLGDREVATLALRVAQRMAKNDEDKSAAVREHFARFEGMKAAIDTDVITP